MPDSRLPDNRLPNDRLPDDRFPEPGPIADDRGQRPSDKADRLSMQRLASEFRTVGWVSFWTQVVLAVVSGVILLLAAPTVGRNPGSGLGVFLAFGGLTALGIGAYWAFRYTRLSRQLMAADTIARPSRGQTLSTLRKGIMSNMAGLLLIIVGSEAAVGALFVKSLRQGMGILGAIGANPSDFIQSIDIFVIQANTHIIAAHFTAMLASLWLLQRVAR
jgi:hypothetical protein